jgi:hypothetical protein
MPDHWVLDLDGPQETFSLQLTVTLSPLHRLHVPRFHVPRFHDHRRHDHRPHDHRRRWQ